MNPPVSESPIGAGRELVIARRIAAPVGCAFTAWTRHLPEWWGPEGMEVSEHTSDLRPGGVFRAVLRAANGAEFPTRGVYLEIVTDTRIVFTDAFGPDWAPHPDAFFTGTAAFASLAAGQSECTLRAMHWTEADRLRHERMGFHHVWGESLDRLAVCARRLAGVGASPVPARSSGPR